MAKETIEQLTDNWQKAKKAAKAAKVVEEEARMKLAHACFGRNLTWDGTETKVLADGTTIKGKVTYSYKVIVDEEELNTALEKMPDHVAESLINWEPKVRVGAYKKMNDTHKEIFDECIEIKPGLIQLEVS